MASSMTKKSRKRRALRSRLPGQVTLIVAQSVEKRVQPEQTKKQANQWSRRWEGEDWQ